MLNSLALAKRRLAVRAEDRLATGKEVAHEMPPCRFEVEHRLQLAET